MNLVVDFGNTRGKAALFRGDKLLEKTAFQNVAELTRFVTGKSIQHALICSVNLPAEQIQSALPIAGQSFFLTAQLPLPFNNQYLTPQTLGVDRLAAAAGASILFPGKDTLVVDAGTCVNYEFIDRAKNYLGGAISPGLRMRFESVHHFTARLPLIAPLAAPRLTGRNTEECIQSGIAIGMIEEIKGVISRYQLKYPNLRVVLCGGDSAFFENDLKPAIFVAPDLVLIGLNGILLHNVKN